MRRRFLSLCLMAVMTVMGMSAWALDQTGGVYQINSLEDYLAFAKLVNASPEDGGNPAANAVLNADIDLGTDGTMIGTRAPDYYQGTFDGQGHAITVNAYPTANYYGLFYRLQNTAEVRNLRVNATITTAVQKVAGLASYTQGAYIHNCYVDCTVNSSVVGDGTHAGVVAVAQRATFIADCFVKFKVNGTETTNCGGIIGWSDNYTTIQNCVLVNETDMKNLSGSGTISRAPDNLQGIDPAEYAKGTRPGGASYGNFATAQWDNVKYVTVVGQDGLKDGSACFQLNSDQSKIVWTQEVGKDEYPLPTPFGSGKQVYASAPTDCHGHVAEGTAVTYSNTPGTATCEKHAIDKFGVCPTCGYYDYTLCPKDDKEHKILLKSAADFHLAEGQNRIARGTFYDMVLMADVELSVDSTTVFNNDNWYGGVFDGQGHTVTINITRAPNGAALFPQLQGTVKNLVLHGSISGPNINYGSVAGHTLAGKTVIENVFSDVQLILSHAGDATCGGIVGLVDADVTLRNVVYAGTLTGEANSGVTNCAGLCGWSSGRSIMENCAFLGNLEGVGGEAFVASRNPVNVVANNCYYLNELEQPAGYTKIEADDVTSGKLAFLLNGKAQGADRFYQTLGTDNFPMPLANGHAKVYGKPESFRCDGEPMGDITYTNEAITPSIPAHQYHGGFCGVCGGIDEHFLTPGADGWFDIKDGNELAWWSCYAAKYSLGSSARLTADITMTAEDNAHYTAIGTELAPFYGNFDGQFHRISGFEINHNVRGVGLISVINSEPKASADDAAAREKEPVVVRDVVLDETCSITGAGYVGVVGMTGPWAGNVLVQNVGMEGKVASSGPNAGGILGCVMNSACRITIDNCYMTGEVAGTAENGAISGWLGSFPTVTNCYAIGTVENPEGVLKDEAGNPKPAEEQTTTLYFARPAGATIRNSFSLYGGEVTQTVDGKETVVVAKVTAEDVENGALAYRANGNTSVKPKWYQNLSNSSEADPHPLPIPTHGVVFKLAGEYMSAANSDELQQVVEAIQNEANEYADSTMAEKALKDAYVEAAKGLASLATTAEVADAYMNDMQKKKSAIATSATKYKNYVDEMAKVQAYLDENLDFTGEEREALEAYFASPDEPNEDYPLGGYLYITEQMKAPSDSLASEITRVNNALQTAIMRGYVAGAEVTRLLTNADFLQGKTGWTGAKGIGVGIYTIQGKKVAGAESYGQALDLTQEVAGMKEGYYLMEVTGAVRPSNDRYGLNYIATLDANGIANYFMADIEDPIAPEDAVDGVNCNITGNTADLPVFEDGYSTEQTQDNVLTGYVMQGTLSMATAINGGTRYKNYTLAHVGQDGKLSVRLRQDKTKGINDWFGFGNIRLTYCGDATTGQTTEALDKVLASQKARANVITDQYVPDPEDARKSPGIPAGLIDELKAAVKAAEEAADNESKMAAVQRLSDLFLLIREAKNAYVEVAVTARTLSTAAEKMGDLVTDAEYATIQEKCDGVFDATVAGSYTLEEAKNLAMFDNTPELAGYVPEKDSVMHLASLKQMAYFCAYVQTVDRSVDVDLVDDIKGFTGDMMINDFNGVFDGKFHTLELNIDKTTDNAAIFLHNDGTVKNLVVTGNITTSGKYAAGVAAHSWSNAVVDRVTVAVNIHSTVSGDGTHGGVIGVLEGAGTKISNSVFCGSINSETTDNCGGFIGWTGNKAYITNCLQIGDLNVGENGSHTWGRYPDNCVVSNSYYLKAFGGTLGTQTTLEKMKSGELCFLLNGSQSEDPAWFQTLGTDTVPHVTPGPTVYYYDGQYINEKPHIELNSYASNITLESDADKVVVSYLLNAPAREGEIRFYKGSEVVYTETLATSDLGAGSHQVTVSNSSLPEAGTALTFDVKVTGYGSKDPARVGEVIKAYSPYGMAIMNDTESASFGNIYLTESDGNDAGYGKGTELTGYISDTKHSALYMFTPLFQVVNAADGTPGWKGGMTDGVKVVASNSYPNADYKTVRTTLDGRLFVGRFSGKSDSPIFEVNPDNMEEAWTPVFTGTIDKETGITYAGDEEQARLSVSFDLAGKGKDMQLLALGMARSDGGFNYTDYKADIYALGTAKQWTGAPTMNFAPLTGQYTIAPMPVSILSDQHGGAWYVQFRSSPSGKQPALKHYNAQGEEDYSDISTSLKNGGCAISPDGTTLAVANGANIIVYTTDYVPMPNKLIDLKPIANFKHLESNISAMAFDYAGNLVVAASGSETVARYVIPSRTDNITVTPASSRCAFKVGEIKTGIENVANETGDQKVYNLQGVRLQKAEKGVNIINGKKVMVK